MFQNLYKQNLNKHERQEIRREKILHQQKLKRFEQQDGIRSCVRDQGQKRNEQSSYKRHKDTNIENIHLQLSEWFKEKPDNLDDWLLVPCPKGQRCLVIAKKGKTKMFSKTKRYCMTFSSLLPGGGLIGSDKDYCILDCIYYQEKDIFYVLDALHFFIPLVDCDAEFRFFWLKSKFSELDGLEENYSKYINLKSFQLSKNYDISDETSLAIALQRYPLWMNDQPKLDGFLFYHKRSHYVFGTSPLFCWLLPFMLPDILHLEICNAYEPPPNYCKQNPWQYMVEFDKEMSHCKRKKTSEYKFSLNAVAMEEDVDSADILDETIDQEDNMLESSLGTSIFLGGERY